MKVLAIDSSAVTASAALTDGETVIKSEFVHTGLTHSETLLPMIKRVMGELPFEALEAIAVTVGPGSFTGVRIGVATAKGLAFAAQIPCIPVSTLEAIAYNFYGEETVVCAVMDARRLQFYRALFAVKENSVTRLTQDSAVSIEDLRKELSSFENVVLAGDGAALCHEHIALPHCCLAEETKRYQQAVSVARAAQQQKAVAQEALLPLYLRQSQAERELKLKRNKH